MSDSKRRTDAAQAVYEAAHQAWVTKDSPEPIAAATLRAAADQADSLMERCGSPQQAEGRPDWFDALLEIATELEGHHG
ncbi:MAG: hypothetical protein LW834_06740 [Cyanobium sp. 49614_E6]|jgi:hypothetical protein|nr:hypothetical protein [Cyanobium sp. 49614_E6]